MAVSAVKRTGRRRGCCEGLEVQGLYWGAGIADDEERVLGSEELGELGVAGLGVHVSHFTVVAERV